jgi:hypothetical protein
MSQQFRDKVAGYTDLHIADLLHNQHEYTPESVRIAEEEAESRGGLDQLFDRVNKELAKRKRLDDLEATIREEIAAGEQPDVLIRWLAGEGLEGDDVDERVHAALAAHNYQQYEQTDTAKSVMLTLLGGLVASIGGGVYLSFLVFGSEKIAYAVIAGFFVLPFGIVWLFSGGKKTGLMITISIASMVLAVLIGLWMSANGILVPT